MHCNCIAQSLKVCYNFSEVIILKKYFLFTIIIILCVFGTACGTDTDNDILIEPVSSAFEDTMHTENNDEENSALFRTISGECYHNNGCRYL